jgi:hypothetical protein
VTLIRRALDGLPDAPAAPPMSYLSPAISLAFDFLDAVWRLKFGKEHKLLQLRLLTPTTDLERGCSTREEFQSRLSALADTLKSMRIDDQLLKDHPKKGDIRREQSFKRLLASLARSIYRLSPPPKVRTERNLQNSRFEPDETGSPVDLGCRIPAKCAFAQPVAADWRLRRRISLIPRGGEFIAMRIPRGPSAMNGRASLGSVTWSFPSSGSFWFRTDLFWPRAAVGLAFPFIRFASAADARSTKYSRRGRSHESRNTGCRGRRKLSDRGELFRSGRYQIAKGVACRLL